MDKQRDISFDLMKSVGMFAVVAFHCNFMGHFFFLFNNPLFMFVAGIFHPHEASSTRGVGGYYQFLKKRFFKIYVPFVCLTTFLTLFQPLFSKLGLVMESPYSGNKMLVKLLTIIPMRVEGFSAPCWFLVSLLEISVILETFRFFTHNLPRKIEGLILITLGLFLFPIGLHIQLPRYLSASFILLIWYVAGFYLRDLINEYNFWRKNISRRKTMMLYTSLVLLCVVVSGVLIHLSKKGVTCGSGFAPYVFLGSAMGIVWCWCIAQFLGICSFASYLALPGKCSFTIMAWHLGAFRLLGVFITLIIKHQKVSDIPVKWAPYAERWYIAIAYCIVGICLPILGKKVWDMTVQAIKRKQFSL